MGTMFLARLHAQVSELGAAANYAGLELSSDPGNGSATEFTISSGNTRVYGNIGVASGGYINFGGGGQVSGEIDAGSGATVTITGGSAAAGGTVEPYANMSQIVTSALNAANYYAGLTATQTFSSITASQTISGTGGLNVIDINGDVNLQGGSALTLSGSSSDQFVINVDASGVAGNPADMTLGGGSSIVLNGISASQVVFNLIGSGLELNSNGNSDDNGVFLAATGSITISGGVHNADFIAGRALTFQSGPIINQVALVPVPELSPVLMAGCSLALLGGLSAASRLGRGFKSGTV